MERRAVASRALVSAGYDPEHRVLEVEFRSGRVYRYDGVPESVYEWLMRTEHKGAYLARMIDGHYAYEEVTPRADAAPVDLAEALRASIHRLDGNREGEP